MKRTSSVSRRRVLKGLAAAAGTTILTPWLSRLGATASILPTAVQTKRMTCASPLPPTPGEHASTTQPVRFATLSLPEGITIDSNGNIYVLSLDPQNPFQNLLTKFSPTGTVLDQWITSEDGRMITDLDTDLIWLLSGKKLFQIDPAASNMSLLLDINDLSINTDNVYDVAITGPFLGVIDPQAAAYGDLAFLKRGNQTDLFISGHYNAWHFVMRIRLINQNAQSAQVIVASGASLAPYDNGPHGVAVNDQGTVLTTLGWAPPGEEDETVDRPVAFAVDFPQDQGLIPDYILDESKTFSSQGMTSDAAGNFYVATGQTGGGAACGWPGLIVLPPELGIAACYLLESSLAHPVETAVSPTDGAAYVTDLDQTPFSDDDYVWRFAFDGPPFSRSYLPLIQA